ncbi:MAG: transcriptional regulator NrdR, partial [Coriobacteriales bacterium]|nr:transcriptional regulator NrdR [Coriobacteriales bacterium]
MYCPHCGHEESKVVDSRIASDGTSTRRRRECLKCKRRFTTYEKIETTPLMISKKDGSVEPFDKSKLLRSIITSSAKR